jgi:hypothetical protein
MSEEWRPVPGYEGSYEASSHGRIRSLTRLVKYFRGTRVREGVILKQSIGRSQSSQYLAINFSKDGVTKIVRVHRVIAETFFGEIPKNAMVRHLDGDSLNNYAENLCIGSYKENWRDAISHGTASIGQDHAISKLTNENVFEIRRMLKEGVAQWVIAEKFNVAQTNISHIHTGRSWGGLK